MVTHDFGEALSLADRGAVLHQGAIKQIGTIQNIFQKPISAPVAEFVGMKNLFEVDFRNGTPAIDGHKISLTRAPDPLHKYLAIRPEDIAIALEPFPPNNGKNTFCGLVTSVSNRGFTYEVHVKTGGFTFISAVTRKVLVDSGLTEGLDVYISFDAESVHTL